MTEEEVFDIAGSRGEFEQSVLSRIQINAFAEDCISERDREILRLRMEGYTEQEIADRAGGQTASAIHKRISRIAGVYEGFVTEEHSHHRILPHIGFAAA